MLITIRFVIFIILFLQITTSCTKPFENESKILVNAPETVYEVDYGVILNEFAVSPVDDKLAIVKEEKFSSLYRASSTIDSSDTLFNGRLTNYEGIGRTQALAPGGQRIAYYKTNRINIYEIETGNTSNFPIPPGISLKKMKWSTHPDILYYVYYNGAVGFEVISLNINTGFDKRLINTDITINDIAYNDTNKKIYFRGSRSSSYISKIYIFNTTGGILDSLNIVESNYYAIDISHDGSKFSYVARDSLYNMRLKIFNTNSNQLELEFDVFGTSKTCAWSPDDTQILLSHSSGYSVLDIYSNTLTNFRTTNYGNYSEYKVWGENDDTIFYLVEREERDMFTFDESSQQSEFHFSSNYKIENIDWSNDGTKLLYNLNRKLWQIDLTTNESKLITTSFKYVSKGIWNSNDEWICLLNYRIPPNIGLYNTNSSEFFSIPTLDTLHNRNIEWTNDPQKFCVIGGDYYAKIYTWKNNTFTPIENIKLKADKIRWRPLNSAINNIGEYVAYSFISELGVYLFDSEIRNVQDQHVSSQLISFDWSKDGRSLYYLHPYRIAKEQIFYNN
jgi:hypothetical protein